MKKKDDVLDVEQVRLRVAEDYYRKGEDAFPYPGEREYGGYGSPSWVQAYRAYKEARRASQAAFLTDAGRALGLTTHPRWKDIAAHAKRRGTSSLDFDPMLDELEFLADLLGTKVAA
jgi:hypothetical protein